MKNSKRNYRFINKKGGTKVEYTSKPVPPPPPQPKTETEIKVRVINDTSINKIKAVEEYIKQLEHDIQMHRATDREYAKCLDYKLSGVKIVYYMIKNS